MTGAEALELVPWRNPDGDLQMTKDKNFKRRVRERMLRTGESYTTARAQLARRFRRDPEAVSARDRAAAELKLKFDQLHDAVDGALAAGLTWREVADRLQVDRGMLERWFNEEGVTP